ncbi:MAG TPA: hypothetical protein DCR21_07985, partial [Succinivibrionaceae bacterium]|nr:hypothetical protein [Succinivibrionaceae bacterium]
MVDFNLTLKQFEDISNGKINAGIVDVKSSGNKFKLTKANHHATFQSFNFKSLTPEKIVKIKESFIGALEKEHLNQEAIGNIRKSLGLEIASGKTVEENREILNRRFTPLTRQQIKEYIALARGQEPEQNRNLAVQQNVLNGLPKNEKVKAKALVAVSYLSGAKLSDIQNLQADDLKFFAKQPKILNRVYKNVKALTYAFYNDPNRNNMHISSYLFRKGHHDDVFTLKIVKGENNQPFITGSVTIDNDTIPLNFMVHPQEYLDSINQRLVDFMDVLPDVKAENNISLGKNYLIQNIETLKSDLSLDQLNSAQPNHLRSLCLAIMKRDNQEINPEVERLCTDSLFNIAKNYLQNDYGTEDLNQVINGAIKGLELLADNLVPGQMVQPAVPQNVQDPQVQANADNVAQNNVQDVAQNDVQNQDVALAELYEAPVYNDSKNITSYTNQLFDLIGQPLQANDKQNVDFNAVKTLLLNNTDVMLSFVMNKTALGNYEEEVNGNKNVITPKFNGEQLTALFNQVLDDYKEATGKAFNAEAPTKAQVDDLKLFLQNTATAQNLDKSVTKAMTFVTTQFIRGQVPDNDIEQAQGEAPARPFPDLTFKDYAKNFTVNKFLTGLAK